MEAEGAAGLRGCSGALAGGSRWVPEALPPRVSFPADAGLPAPGPGSLPRPGVAGPVARRCPPWEPTRGSRSWRSAWGWLVLKQEAFLRHLPFLRLFGLVLGPCQTVSRPEVFRVGISQSGKLEVGECKRALGGAAGAVFTRLQEDTGTPRPPRLAAGEGGQVARGGH